MIVAPKGELGPLATCRRAQERRQREEPPDLMAGRWQGKRGVQQAWRVAGADEAGSPASAEQQGEGVGVDAGAVHLDGEVEALGLHAAEEIRGRTRLEELL